jgi:hypothetical protein
VTGWRRAAWAAEAWSAELASRWRRWTVLPGDTVVHGLRDVRGTVVRVDAREVVIELAPGWVEGWPRGLEGWDRVSGGFGDDEPEGAVER